MLTVIIPVYKVAQTLDRCVESVLRQDVPHMEVILVDDGSPDQCPRLCDEWAARDSRIRVLHKENGGLSDARNAGLDVAKGDLITFVDSDDYLALDTYNKVLQAMAPDADIIEFPVVRHYGSPRQKLLSFETSFYSDKHDYWFQAQAYTHTYAWNKIYRRRLFDGVRFPKGRVFEDVATLPLLLDKAKKVQTTDQGLYYYCDNQQGITATASGEDLRQLLVAHLDHWDVRADDAYYLHVLNIQLDVCRLLDVKPLMPQKKVRDYKSLDCRLQLKARLVNVLGLERLCWIYKTVQKVRKRL